MLHCVYFMSIAKTILPWVSHGYFVFPVFTHYIVHIIYYIIYYNYIIYIFTIFISQSSCLGEKEHGLPFMAEGLRLRDAGVFSRTAAEPTFWDTGDCCSSIIPGMGKLACGPL